MSLEPHHKVLFITRKWPPAIGGMETYAVEMVTELRKLGHTVEPIALPGQPDGSAPGPGALLRFGLVTGLRLLWRRRPGTVVLGGDMAVWPLVWAACLGSGAQPVLTAHGTDISLAGRRSLKGRLYAAYLGLGRRMLPGTHVVANSGATEGRLQAAGFRQTSVAPLGCRVSVAEPQNGLERTLLFSGRLVALKGLGWFVAEVLPKLPSDIRLAVAGTRWDASEDAALKDPRVEFLGPLPQPELWSHMAGAMAVVVPNIREGSHQFEGFGLIAVEAAAAGGIVLAAKLDGYLTSVIDGETGILLPAGDAAAWARAITDIAAMSKAARATRQATAKAAATRQFNWARTAAETARFFK